MAKKKKATKKPTIKSKPATKKKAAGKPVPLKKAAGKVAKKKSSPRKSAKTPTKKAAKKVQKSRKRSVGMEKKRSPAVTTIGSPAESLAAPETPSIINVTPPVVQTPEVVIELAPALMTVEQPKEEPNVNPEPDVFEPTAPPVIDEAGVELDGSAIARRAYEIWVDKGYPDNDPSENWLQAERELRIAALEGKRLNGSE